MANNMKGVYKMQNYLKSLLTLKDKAYGFFVTVGLSIFAIILLIVYFVSYKGVYSSGMEVFSWSVFTFLLLIPILNIVMFFLKLSKFNNYVTGALVLVTICFFIYSIYYLVSVMATGIDATFDAPFISNVILFVILWVGSIVNIFLPQIKSNK